MIIQIQLWLEEGQVGRQNAIEFDAGQAPQ
jgi:hypothetical protein